MVRCATLARCNVGTCPQAETRLRDSWRDLAARNIVRGRRSGVRTSRSRVTVGECLAQAHGYARRRWGKSRALRARAFRLARASGVLADGCPATRSRWKSDALLRLDPGGAPPKRDLCYNGFYTFDI